MNLGMELHQAQKLVLTTHMQQSIQILSLTADELEAYLQDMTRDNPLIEYTSPSKSLREPLPIRQRRTQSGGNRNQDNVSIIEQTVPYHETMIDALESQIRLMSSSRRAKRTALFLIGLLDHHGYLRESDETLLKLCRVTPSELTEALALIRDLSPLGIGARNLQDCLLLQLPLVAEEKRALAKVLIESHLEDIAAGRLAKISKLLKVSVDEIQVAIDAVKCLNPRPAMELGAPAPQYIVPDVYVRKQGSTYKLIAADGLEPSLSINDSYLDMLRSVDDTAVQQFLRHQFAAAQSLSTALKQRQSTVFRVAEVILDIQQPFFENGPLALKPMTLRDIAELLNLHESTVSRAVRGKYMDTPRGVFELKYFLSAKLAGEGAEVSSAAAKEWIVRLVEQENKQEPFSDEALAKLIRAKGIYLSRRTVAKYREELHIASSTRRRRFLG